MTKLGLAVPRPEALKNGPGKTTMLAIFVGDPRCHIDGKQGAETLSLAGSGVPTAGALSLADAYAAMLASGTTTLTPPPNLNPGSRGVAG
eukprot:CAMPEP_0180184890 /NCGR_PEP_ID=MMETSP0986-20121125/42093_1 /TAXON_ID=697907 /ORGANISM="non described non described, Strain CCMP2293" /LENGTH=89 /DNA_ID=CAMNT_0022138661 /DNA_START=99 /DNA_END=365 /DNA_ORIENTATION=-